MDERYKKLMKLAINGNVAAFEELIQPHQNKIYNLMLKTCCNEFEASQLAQEVFIKVFRSISLWKDSFNLALNIYKIAEEIIQQAACKSKMIS
ncbi:MAG: sigma factor [Clostridiaceae bacterium]